jgi:hypothetical protein
LLAAGISLIVYSSKTIVEDRASPILAIVYSSLVLGHFLVPVARRTTVLYGVLLIVGIVSTVFYALGTDPLLFPFVCFLVISCLYCLRFVLYVLGRIIHGYSMRIISSLDISLNLFT